MLQLCLEKMLLLVVCFDALSDWGRNMVKNCVKTYKLNNIIYVNNVTYLLHVSLFYICANSIYVVFLFHFAKNYICVCCLYVHIFLWVYVPNLLWQLYVYGISTADLYQNFYFYTTIPIKC